MTTAIPKATPKAIQKAAPAATPMATPNATPKATQTAQAATAPTVSVSKPSNAKLPAKQAAPRKTGTQKTSADKLPAKALATAKVNKQTNSVATPKIVKAAKVESSKKPKLVRDSFTIPKVEYLALTAMKQRAVSLTRSTKKSELLRAAIMVLAGLSDAAFLSALAKVPAIKTGRPASGN